MESVKEYFDLMSYRVRGSPDINYKSKEISKDDIIKRRAAMRQILRDSQFNNQTNDSLDSMRIEKTDNGYIVEDSEGYETIIGYKLKNAPNNATNTDKGKNK